MILPTKQSGASVSSEQFGSFYNLPEQTSSVLPCFQAARRFQTLQAIIPPRSCISANSEKGFFNISAWFTFSVFHVSVAAALFSKLQTGIYIYIYLKKDSIPTAERHKIRTRNKTIKQGHLTNKLLGEKRCGRYSIFLT